MKRRYSILFALAVISMVGWSWHTSATGQSLWALDMGRVGLIAAVVASGLALLAGTQKRWPTIIVATGALLGTGQVPVHGRFSPSGLVSDNGTGALLVLFASIATLTAALLVAFMERPVVRREAPRAHVRRR